MANQGTDKAAPELHINFSISGGCFLYQLGCAYFIQRHFDTKSAKVKFSGSSGGGVSALLLASNVDITKALKVILEEVTLACRENSSFGVLCIYEKICRSTFRRLFEGLVLKDLLRDEVLAISVTRIGLFPPFFTEEVITAWESNEDVVDAGIASALVPFAVNGRPFSWYRGGLAFDGAITNVLGSRKYEPKVPQRGKSLIATVAEAKKKENLVETVGNFVWDTYSTVSSIKSSLFSILSASRNENKKQHTAAEVSMKPTGSISHIPESERPYGLFRLAKLATYAIVYPAIGDSKLIIERAKALPRAMLMRFQSTAIKILRRLLPRDHPLFLLQGDCKFAEEGTNPLVLTSSPTRPPKYDHRERNGILPQYPGIATQSISGVSYPVAAWSSFVSWIESAPEDESVASFDKWLNETLQAAESSTLVDSVFLFLGYKLVPISSDKSSNASGSIDTKICADFQEYSVDGAIPNAAKSLEFSDIYPDAEPIVGVLPVSTLGRHKVTDKSLPLRSVSPIPSIPRSLSNGSLSPGPMANRKRNSLSVAATMKQQAQKLSDNFLFDQRRSAGNPLSPGRALSASAIEKNLSSASVSTTRISLKLKHISFGKKSNKGSGSFKSYRSSLSSSSSSKSSNILLQDTFLHQSGLEPSFLPSRSSSQHGNLWSKRHRVYRTIRRILDDGSEWTARVMDICPWTWRHHPMNHYSLISDIEKMQTLFELGYRDAYDNRDQFLAFFEDTEVMEEITNEEDGDKEASKIPNFDFFDVYPAEDHRANSIGSLSATLGSRDSEPTL